MQQSRPRRAEIAILESSFVVKQHLKGEIRLADGHFVISPDLLILAAFSLQYIRFFRQLCVQKAAQRPVGRKEGRTVFPAQRFICIRNNGANILRSIFILSVSDIAGDSVTFSGSRTFVDFVHTNLNETLHSEL